MEHNEILKVKSLKVDFATEQGTVHAVRDVSFSVREGEILGLVGESGSGKSVSMYSVMGLLADNGTVSADEIEFNGENINAASYPGKRGYEKVMQSIRGNTMTMIFQDPMTFLNPTITIGKQLMEPILNHTKLTRQEARARAVELMTMVGIPSPEKRLDQYPFEFSGGMRQRIIIAMALANDPKLIIADEPTTALDVTIQAQILELLKKLNAESGISMLFISHNLHVVRKLCKRVAVMEKGHLVEEGDVETLFRAPQHPYTRRLIDAIPRRERKEDHCD